MISEYENNNKYNNNNNLSRSSLVGSVFLLFLGLKASVQIPGQSSLTKRNIKKIFPVT